MWNRDDVARFPSTAIAYRSIFVLVGDLDVRRFLEPIFLHHRRNLFSLLGKHVRGAEEKQFLRRTIAYLLLFTILFARMTSVLERGRDRIFRQFHAVYRYDHDDRSLRGDALLWLRFTSAFRVSMFRYVTTFCLSPLFIRSITCSIPLDRSNYPRSEFISILARSPTICHRMFARKHSRFFLSKCETRRAFYPGKTRASREKARGESQGIETPAQVDKKARDESRRKNTAIGKTSQNSPVVVWIGVSTSAADDNATTPPIRQSPAIARRKHLSWIRILPHSSVTVPRKRCWNTNRALTGYLVTRSNRR